MREMDQNVDSHRSLPEQLGRGLLSIGVGALAVGAAMYQENPDFLAHAKRRFDDLRSTLRVSGPNFVMQAVSRANSFLQPAWSKLKDQLQPATSIDAIMPETAPDSSAEFEANTGYGVVFTSAGGLDKNKRKSFSDYYDHVIDPGNFSIGLFRTTTGTTTNPNFHISHAVDVAEIEMLDNQTSGAFNPTDRMSTIMSTVYENIKSGVDLSGCVAMVYNKTTAPLLAGALIGNSQIDIYRGSTVESIRPGNSEVDGALISAFSILLQAGDRVTFIPDSSNRGNGTTNTETTDITLAIDGGPLLDLAKPWEIPQLN